MLNGVKCQRAKNGSQKHIKTYYYYFIYLLLILLLDNAYWHFAFCDSRAKTHPHVRRDTVCRNCQINYRYYYNCIRVTQTSNHL